MDGNTKVEDFETKEHKKTLEKHKQQRLEVREEFEKR